MYLFFLVCLQSFFSWDMVERENFSGQVKINNQFQIIFLESFCFVSNCLRVLGVSLQLMLILVCHHFLRFLFIFLSFLQNFLFTDSTTPTISSFELIIIAFKMSARVFGKFLPKKYIQEEIRLCYQYVFLWRVVNLTNTWLQGFLEFNG